MSGDLGGRIPTHGREDEFDRLSATLNAMFARIEALIGNLRTTTDSLAHDLRSPLTRLRRQTDILLNPDTDELKKHEAAQRAQAETDHVLRVFTGMTEIARAEAGLARSDFERVNLEQMAQDAVELYEPVAADNNIDLRLEGECPEIQGNAPLLAQALSNLLENALAFTPQDGTIIVKLSKEFDQCVVSISDNGPGIPEEHRARVTERFVTLDDSRSSGRTGLGLALVKAVAHMHDGELTLRDNEPGLSARLTLSCSQT